MHRLAALPVLLLALPGRCVEESARGLPTSPDWFPIGVWLQQPRNAARYKEAGINLYIGLWKGPTTEQLAELEAAGMPVICSQNEVGLNYQGRAIVGWMHSDEPDNAQPTIDPSTGKRTGWGSPVPPAEVVADYERLKERDPSRPVLLNLGQGVANDQWRGRGSGAMPEDYLTYVKGADIVSFDVYPVAGIGKPDGENYLWYVARGVERLRRWTEGRKPVWAVLETTRISSERRATPEQVRSEAWMALISGASGLLYFTHEFKPSFNEWRLLDDPEMLAGVTALNREILDLAPVLNSPSVEGLSVETPSADVPVAAMLKRHGGQTWLFAVGLRNAPTTALFRLPEPRGGTVEVIGEERRIELAEGCFSDRFDPYEVHLYRVD